MFGQPPSSSPFGSAAPAPFGTPAPTFGSTATPSAFGTTPAAPSAPSFGFGSPTPATGFGTPPPAFGTATSTAPPPAGFGSSGAFGTPAGGGFGSTATTTPFGAPAPASGGLFGAPAPAPGLFGAAAPAPGLFGAAGPAPSAGLFGAPAAAPAFGAAAPAAPSFGFGAASAPAPASGGLFGAPAPALFGGGGGAPAPAPFGGFGGGMNQQQRPGTLSQPWSATNRSDGSSNMSLQAITAMTAYENKSFEELRLEDYTNGNKGSQGQQQGSGGGFGGGFGGSGGGFGSAGGGGGLFGGNAPAPAAFGASASTPAFGAPAFGAPAPAAAAPAFGGSTFGAPAPAPSTGFGFGAAANKPATGLFGSAPAPAPGGLFGAPAPAPAGGLFGAAPAATPSTSPFGAPATAPSTGLFGAPAPAPSTGLFGKPSAPAPSTGLFGAPATAPSTNLFGAPAPAPTSLFGAPAPAPSGGFFGAPAPSTSLFGAPAPAPTTGLFGSAAPAPTTGLFGAPAPAPSLFGAPAPAAPSTSTSLFGQSPPLGAPQPNADTLLAQQLAAIENQKKELALLEPWRSLAPSNKEDTPLVPVSTNDSTLRSYAAGGIKNMPKAIIRIKQPRGGSPKVSLKDTSTSPLLSPAAFLSGGAKRLVIQPSSLRPPPKMKLLMNGEEKEEEKQAVNKTLLFQSSPKGEWHSRGDTTPHRTDLGVTSPQGGVSTPKADTTPTAPPDYSYELYKQVTNNSDSKSDGLLPDQTTPLPSLTKQGYHLQPPLSSLQSMTEVQLATVPNFTISRSGYGSVTWEGKVDIRNVDLDKIVSIEEREIFVYDEEEMNGTKPPVGEQLNRPAVITLERVFPKAKSSRETFEAKILKITKKMGAEFIEYDGNSGIWKFRVSHFSRYGLYDDSDDEDEEENAEEDVVTGTKKVKKTCVIMEDDNLERVDSCDERVDDKFPDDQPDENTSPLISKGFHMIAPNDDDDDSQSDDESSHEEDNSQHGTTNAFQKAEDAYRAMMMQSAMNPMYDSGGVVMKDVTPVSPRGEESYDEEGDVEETSEGEEEEEDESDYTIPTPILPSVTDCRISSRLGFCAAIAQRCSVTNKTSAVDYGMRLGRSFRSGVTPIGSIVVPRDDVIREHQWEMTNHSDTDTLTSVLKVHLAHAVATPTLEENGIPLFSLPAGLGANGTQSSYSQLCIALDHYISITKDSATTTIPHQAFCLLSLLYGQNENTNTLLSSDSPRRSAALRVFFRHLNESDVRLDVKQALNQKNPPEAILAAVIGGDYKLACRLAMTHGYDRLATLLACPVVSAEDVRRQREDWEQSGTDETMPEALRRVYALLGGERDLEENENTHKELDWKRRLQIILETQPSENIKNHIYQYENDVQSNIAPPPLPHYYNTHQNNSTCLLWRILKLRATNGGRSFREGGSVIDVVSPEGYTTDDHDLSWAFHLAALLHAFGCAPQMTDVEHDRLIDGFSAQLINKGLWEWAVYVTLNTTKGTTTNPKQKIEKAKSIIHRHFTPDSFKKRSFLEEQLKIPPSIFDMALADCHAYCGQAMPYVTQLIKANSPKAITATEQLIIPNSIIQGSTHLTPFLMTMKENLQEAPEWNRVNGCGAILDLLQLSTEVYDFSRLSCNERQEMIKLGRIDEWLSLVCVLQSRISMMAQEQSDDKSKTTTSTSRVHDSDETCYIDFLPFGENNNIHDTKNVCFKDAVAALTKLYMRLLSYKIDDKKQVMMDDSLSQLSLSTMKGDGLSYHDVVPEDENKKHVRAGNMHYFVAL